MDSDSSVFQNVIIVAQYGSLPDPIQFVNQAKDLAWPQVLAFSTAILGILTVILILRSVTKS